MSFFPCQVLNNSIVIKHNNYYNPISRHLVVANTNWIPTSWKKKIKNKYTPSYDDKDKLNLIKKKLKYNRPPLVFSNEIVTLRKQLVDVSDGKSFIIQGGECAESIDNYDTNNVIDMMKALIVMSLIVSYTNDIQVIKILRGAGQYAKPRSSPTETIDDVTLNSYFGDNINGLSFNEKSRQINATRMLIANDISAHTMNLMRSMSSSGFLSLYNLQQWVKRDLKDDVHINVYDEYNEVLDDIERSIKFMSNCGVINNDKLNAPEIFTSHEALLLDYEESMIREDSTTKKNFNCSGHFLWLGDRTRDVDGQHVEFLRGVENPIGIKISKNTDLSEIVDIIKILNPHNDKGKICLICRYGDDHITNNFEILINVITFNKLNVIYMVDPMHGNTYTLENGYKTRNFNKILSETNNFFNICNKKNVYPGGVHIEMTGNDDSSECINGLIENKEEHVSDNYKSNCDPRLNLSQCIEYAFKLHKFRGS